MKVGLDSPLTFEETLKDLFWPTTRVAPSFKDEFTETRNVIKSMMKTSILLARLVIVLRSRFVSIGICMRDIFWLLGHLKMMENILYGLQGRCQIQF